MGRNGKKITNLTIMGHNTNKIDIKSIKYKKQLKIRK